METVLKLQVTLSAGIEFMPDGEAIDSDEFKYRVAALIEDKLSHGVTPEMIDKVELIYIEQTQ